MGGWVNICSGSDRFQLPWVGGWAVPRCYWLSCLSGSSSCPACWCWQVTTTGRHQQAPTGQTWLGTGVGSPRQVLGGLPSTLNLGRIGSLLRGEVMTELSIRSLGWCAQFQLGDDVYFSLMQRQCLWGKPWYVPSSVGGNPFEPRIANKGMEGQDDQTDQELANVLHVYSSKRLNCNNCINRTNTLELIIAPEVGQIPLWQNHTV